MTLSNQNIAEKRESLFPFTRQSLEPYLLIERQTVEFNRRTDYWLGVAESQAGLARHLLQKQAAQLEDAATRQAFPENVAVHQAIVTAVQDTSSS